VEARRRHGRLRARGAEGARAPRVVAKGTDSFAKRIRDTADQAGIPVVSDPPLARALYLVPEDKDIPQEYFAAVAEVIAFVWRLRRGPAR
jgi:flagellar biosynthetic protein FlhB